MSTTMKKLKCRVHGGYFTVPARRGRPPVKCTEENKCDAQTVAIPKQPQRRSANPQASEGTKSNPTVGYGPALPKMPTSAATPASSNASATGERAIWVANKAASTKEINRLFRQLIELGWEAKRAWLDDVHAEITATRGEEMIWIVVKAGTVIEQQYSLWNFDKPSLNRKPAHNLPFDPDEIGDRELVRLLIGTRVTWYNKLSGKEEHGVCGKETLKIEHGYNARGDEVPGERIVKFVDPDRQHFVAFRLDALLKVGK